MLIFVLAYLGGVLTIFSPCVLPVLPFIFARSDRSLILAVPITAAIKAVCDNVHSLKPYSSWMGES